MFEFFASLFGYLLSFLYNLINNYGIAIILFTIIIKLILIPLSINQQKTMKKSAKIQEKMKAIQFKYKNDPEKMNQEIMDLYKNEKMSPFSGCLTAIVQLLLLLSIFYLVKSPITYMEKIPTEDINKYVTQLQEEGREISKVYPIPILYIISSFVSIRMTTAMQEKKKEKEKAVIEVGENQEEQKENEMDAVMQTNKMMSWMMPIMSISIAFVAPLGLALYWLISNILMILERIILDKAIAQED